MMFFSRGVADGCGCYRHRGRTPRVSAGRRRRGFWSSFQFVTMVMGQLIALGVGAAYLFSAAAMLIADSPSPASPMTSR